MQFTSMDGQQQNFPELTPDQIYPHQAPALTLIDSAFDGSGNRSPAWLGAAAIEVVAAACLSASRGSDVPVCSLIEQIQ